MSESLKIIAALARSIGAVDVSLGVNDDITAAIAAMPGATTRDDRYEATEKDPWFSGPYSIRSAAVEIDGVRVRSQCEAVEIEVAA